MKLSPTITGIVLLLVAIALFIFGFFCFCAGEIWQGLGCLIVAVVFGLAGINTLMESDEPKKPNI